MSFRQLPAIAAVLIATFVAFLPVLSNEFVNWDDPPTLVDNPRLAAPGVVTWAFTTSEMSHYQPLAWLVWSATKSLFGLEATAFHALSLIGHLVNVALVYVVCARVATLAGLHQPRVSIAALVAAFAFAVHPLRVEAVAWASAFPYVLSLLFLLTSLLVYITWAGGADGAGGAGRAGKAGGWLWLSVMTYALSQFARASAVAFPLVLLLIDAFPLRRRLHLREKIPFLIVALAAGLAESWARELATLEEVGLGARLTMAATAPFLYLWRTVFPVGLSPLDPLPIEPRLAWIPFLLGIAGLTALTVLVWRMREKRPVLAVVWAAYLLLLAPAMGLTPSGQQATADRYMYVPGVAVSVLIGAAAASDWVAQRRRFARALAVVGLVAAAALIPATRQQAMWWRDSIVLWTRAADLDARNDIATYNLAIALNAAGREEDAIARYEQTLTLVPDHDLARQNLERLRAKRADKDVADTSGRAFALVQAGRHREAAELLTQALSRHPDNHELAHNLARLLATTPDPNVRNGPVALRLALAVREQIGSADPRVLDTLAAAFAANSQFDRAHETALAAARVAAAAGDQEMARFIENEARRYLELHRLRDRHPASRDRD
jgi:tetratricopeptide (TPR) repeat protein